MPIPTLAVSSDAPTALPADVLVVAARTLDGAPSLLLPDGLTAADLRLAEADLAALGIGGTGDLTRLPLPGAAAPVLAVIGVGGTDRDALRAGAAAAVRRLAGAAHVAIAFPTGTDLVAATLEGAALGAYAYLDYRVTTLAKQKAPVTAITVLGTGEADAAIERAAAVAESVALVKDLVNMPPNDCYPVALADRAQAVGEAGGLQVRVWDVPALVADGFGGILGVGQGSTRPPRLVRLEWAPEGATKTVALIGKGITFDSGGLSLKPAGSMAGMKNDMTGAATVLAVVAAAARLQLAIGVTAWLCIAENMPSGSAIRPNDVLRIRGGRTVEVLNTDAEGRLVLADGIVAASEEQPTAIVDVATLTGAIITALGTRYVGAMGDGDLIGQVVAASKRAGELVWHLPLPEESRTMLNSDVADIANVKIGNAAGGALVAGQFLKEFVGTDASGSRIPWVHLDIAGAANNAGGAYGVTGAGPTGVMVRTLLALLEDLAAQAPGGAESV